MSYVISHHAPWLAATLILGVIVGAITFRNDRPRLMDGIAWAFVFAWLIGCLAAYVKLLPGRAGSMLEVGLLMCFAYGVGCFIGWAIRRWNSETVPDLALAGQSAHQPPLGLEPAMLTTVSAWIKDALKSDQQPPAKPDPTQSTTQISQLNAASAPPADLSTPTPLTTRLPSVLENVTQEGMPSMMRDRFTRVFTATTIPESDLSSRSDATTVNKPPVIPMRSSMFTAAKPAKTEAAIPNAPRLDLAPTPKPAALNGTAPAEPSAPTASPASTEFAAVVSLVRQRLHLPDLSRVMSRLEAEKTRLRSLSPRPTSSSPTQEQSDRTHASSDRKSD